MTREETQNLLAMMQAAYQNYNPPSKNSCGKCLAYDVAGL